MDYTKNHKLKKPSMTDTVDINDLNSNMDIIDEALTPTLDVEKNIRSNSGKLVDVLSGFANRTKAVTGKNNWYDDPSTTLETANTHINAAAPHKGHATTADLNSLAGAGRTTETVKGVSDAINSLGIEVKSQMDENAKDISQLSNPNLLINGDFQVWQRSESFNSVNGAKYTADRWRGENNIFDGVSVKKVENGLKMIWNKDCIGTIQYYMENIDFKKIQGKIVTLSWSVDNKINVNTYEFQPYADNINTENPKVIQIGYNGKVSEIHVFNWVKLELGEIATPFVPKSYAEELAMCQRYYREFSISSVCGRNLKQYDSVVVYHFDNSMRVFPTMEFQSVKGTKNIINDGNGQDLNGTFLATNNNSTLTITYRDSDEKNLANNTCQCYLKLDSEIY